MVYYVGTSTNIPLIPFDTQDPAFNVSEADPTEGQAARAHLATPYVHYVGSSTDCGCNFRCDAFGDPYDKREDPIDVQADHDALANYLESLPSEAEPIRIFGCWSGNEADPPEHTRSCRIADIRAADFAFREGEAQDHHAMSAGTKSSNHAMERTATAIPDDFT